VKARVLPWTNLSWQTRLAYDKATTKLQQHIGKLLVKFWTSLFSRGVGAPPYMAYTVQGCAAGQGMVLASL